MRKMQLNSNQSQACFDNGTARTDDAVDFEARF